MIRQVTIRRFKRFDEVVFDLNGHVVLAGPNNSGKTTMLQAVAAFGLALYEWKTLNNNRRSGRAGAYSKKPIARQAFSSVPLRSFDLLWTDRVDEAPIEISITLQTGQWLDLVFEPDSTEQLYVRPKNHHEPEAVRMFNLPTTFIPSMSGLETEEPVYQRPKLDERLGHGKPGDVLRNLLVIAHEDESAWSALQDSIRRLFGYELLAPNTAGPHIVAEYKAAVNKPPFDIASAGSGFQQVLMLLTFLHTRHSSILLLDEPDAHLHVLLQDAIYGELRSVAAKWNSQLIVATHSEVIINSVAPEELSMLIGSKPRLLASTAERTRLAKSLSILTNVDVMLAENAPGVLFTEDFTDLYILREWAAVLKHPIYEKLRNGILWKKIGTQHREGAPGIKAREYYDALTLVSPDLPGVQLIDGDAGAAGPVEQPITGKGLQTLRWRRYEIESYLFHPAALKRYVVENVGEQAAGPHVAALAEYLTKNHPPGFLENPLADLPFLLGVKARTDLLPPTLEAAGLPAIPYTRYHEIAALMKPDEIHHEVKEKLDAIQKVFNL